jgi:hypothetical protein
LTSQKDLALGLSGTIDQIRSLAKFTQDFNSKDVGKSGSGTRYFFPLKMVIGTS